MGFCSNLCLESARRYVLTTTILSPLNTKLTLTKYRSETIERYRNYLLNNSFSPRLKVRFARFPERSAGTQGQGAGERAGFVDCRAEMVGAQHLEAVPHLERPKAAG